MTSPKNPSDASDPRTWEHVPRIPDQGETIASLLDASGQVLSKGVTILYRDERKALFYPRDLATLSTLQSNAKTLSLIKQNQSLGIRDIRDCEGQCGGFLHWHLKL